VLEEERGKNNITKIARDDFVRSHFEALDLPVTEISQSHATHVGVDADVSSVTVKLSRFQSSRISYNALSIYVLIT
jgi:hypothetical protein